MNLPSSLFRLILLTGILPAALAAQTLVQTLTFDSDDFSAPASATTGYTPTFGGLINQFDADLGTLDAITLAFSFTFSGSTQLGAGGGGAGLSGTGTAYWDEILLGGSGNGTGGGGGPFATVSHAMTIAHDDPVQNLTFLDAMGPGTATFSFAADLTISANSSIQLDSGTLQLTYHYTPAAVPEPSTYAAVLASVALGVVLVRRRHCRRTAS